MVVEADESDGTFVKLPADVAVVTNIDAEHLDHYGDFDGVRAAFHQFVENVPFYGFAVMCLDHPEVQSLIGRIEDRRVITYGQNPQADVRAVDLVMEGPCLPALRSSFGAGARAIWSASTVSHCPCRVCTIFSMQPRASPLRIIWACRPMRSARGLARFSGVKRRFTHTGTWQGVDVYDDYGHHPVEISAVLKAARTATKGKVIAVMQPHRFTRLPQACSISSLPASTMPTACWCPPVLRGGGRRRLPAPPMPTSWMVFAPMGTAMPKASMGRRSCLHGSPPLPKQATAWVCLGAGSITQWANALPDQLKDLS